MKYYQPTVYPFDVYRPNVLSREADQEVKVSERTSRRHGRAGSVPGRLWSAPAGSDRSPAGPYRSPAGSGRAGAAEGRFWKLLDTRPGRTGPRPGRFLETLPKPVFGQIRFSKNCQKIRVCFWCNINDIFVFPTSQLHRKTGFGRPGRQKNFSTKKPYEPLGIFSKNQ